MMEPGDISGSVTNRMKWGYVSKKRQRMGKTSGFYDLGPVEFTDRIFIGLYVKKWP
jgi:hypothetical protein